MSVPESLLEIREYTGEGFRPVVDFGAWRVALLRYREDNLPQHIHAMQRHHETDEVFVLLQGRCVLYLGEGQEGITRVLAQDMEPLKVYNVKCGAWHHHTLSQDAVVLVVENRETTKANSSEAQLSEAQRAILISLAPDWV